MVTVLEYFAAHPDDRYTLSEVARGCRLNKATTHALLTELTARGVLLRHPEEKRYSLGPRLIPIGEAARRGYRAEDFHTRSVARLASAARAETAAVAYDPADDHAYVVGRAGFGGESPVPLRWPMVPPNGAVFFAWSDDASVQAWLARCPVAGAVHEVVTGLEAARRDGVVIGADVPAWRRLKQIVDSREASRPPVSDLVRDALVDLCRSSAFVTGIEPQAAGGEAYVAAPVFDAQGRVTLALVVGSPTDHQRRGDELLAVVEATRALADELTAAVHGRKP